MPHDLAEPRPLELCHPVFLVDIDLQCRQRRCATLFQPDFGETQEHTGTRPRSATELARATGEPLAKSSTSLRPHFACLPLGLHNALH